MNPYGALVAQGPASPQALGATDVVVSQEGLQKLSPTKNAEVVSLLANLYGASMGEEDDDFGKYTRILALPCPQAKAALGEDACKVSQLAALKAMSLPILVDYRSASQQGVTVYIAKDLTTAAALAQPGSNAAIFDPNQAPPKAEKSDMATLLVAGAAGGAAGFLVAGPVGAAVGAGAGALIANWLA